MIKTTSVAFSFLCLLSYFLVVINLIIRPKLKPKAIPMIPHKTGPHLIQDGPFNIPLKIIIFNKTFPIEKAILHIFAIYQEY